MKPDQDSDRLLSPRRPAWTALACVLIVAAGIAAYSNSFNSPFLFDDQLAIQDNRTLRHFPAWENLAPPQANPIARRPVVNLTLALNGAIGGLNARALHIGNLLIHLLAALTLFGVVRRTLLSGRWRAAPPSVVQRPSSSVAVSLAVALIWAVHPLQTESVTYLTQRTESLMGLFFLLTLYCAIRAASSERPRRWYAAAVAACALGMGAKEVMAAAPIVVLLHDRTFISGSFRESLRRRLPFYLCLAATWMVFGALLIAYPWGGTTGAGFGLRTVTPWEYARTQPGVILHYLGLSFWPRPLCLDYGWQIATTFMQIVPTSIALAALLAGTFWALLRAPALGFLGAWFFLILAPTSSIVPILDPCFEHRMYLPLAAVVTASVVAAYGVGERWVRRAAASVETQRLLGRGMTAVAVLSVATVLGCLTFARNKDYRDSISIWQDTTAKRSENARAWNNLGYAYFQAGCRDSAFRCFNKAIELRRNFAEAYNNRGVAFSEINRIPEALEDFDKALAGFPEYAAAYNNRAAAFLRIGRYDEAMAACDKAIALAPEFAQAYDNRGNIFLLTRRAAEAIRNYDRAITLMPDYPNAYDNRANARLLTNRPAEAIPDCDNAIALKPDFADAYNTRASAYLRTGRFDLALRDCDRAIALKPDYADPYINRASARYQMKEYDMALSDLKTYERLGGRPEPEFLKAILRAAGRPG